jgi:hypothetical protein
VWRTEGWDVIFEIVKVLAAVAVALDHARNLHAGELGLEVVQGESGGVEANASDCEAVGGRVDVGDLACECL